jgi:hypothetical protein
MTPEQLQKWNDLINTARRGTNLEQLYKQTVIVDLSLLLAVDKTLKDGDAEWERLKVNLD